MKNYVIYAALFLVSTSNICKAEDINPEKEKLIGILLEQTGQSAISVGKQFSSIFIQQMTTLLKQSKPGIDPKAFDILEEEIDSIMHEEMILNGVFGDMMFPIYNKHFSEEELEKMIELNNTEFGKKLIAIQPVIAQESMQAGQQFGQSLGPKIEQRVIARFEKEGIQYE